MIPLIRDRTAAAIPSNFRGAKRIAAEQELLENERSLRGGLITEHTFKAARWKPAKTQLKVEARDKCAYCEAPTSLVAHGDVEHYRPKSVYWWLAYNYENYLVSCQLCNQTFKSDAFPVRNARLTAPLVRKNSTDAYLKTLAGLIAPDAEDSASVAAFRVLHEAERPLLLNPYYDDPVPHFAWEVDHSLEEVSLVAHPASADAADFVDAAVTLYGLNRLELMKARYQTYFLYMSFRAIAEDAGTPPAQSVTARTAIAKMSRDDSAFAGMIRYFEAQPTFPTP